jgi:hypothetical protein
MYGVSTENVEKSRQAATTNGNDPMVGRRKVSRKEVKRHLTMVRAHNVTNRTCVRVHLFRLLPADAPFPSSLVAIKDLGTGIFCIR